jgi:hypothetical protein
VTGVGGVVGKMSRGENVGKINLKIKKKRKCKEGKKVVNNSVVLMRKGVNWC